MHRAISLCLVVMIFLGCENAPAPAPPATAGLGERSYDLSEVAGTQAMLAVAHDEMGTVIERGFLENDLRQGTWTEFDATSNIPVRVTAYLDGALNGAYLEFDDFGRLTKSAHYRANVLDGPYAEFRNNNPVVKANYVDGKIDGILREFDPRNRKIKKEASYANGVLHGPFRYFNEEGEVMAEWTYRDGEKVE